MINQKLNAIALIEVEILCFFPLKKQKLKRIAGHSSKKNEKMKKIIFLLPILLLLSCYDVERNCKDFKTGKFKFEYEVDGVKKTTVFERKDSIEIETFEGKTDTASIRWINDCEYILRKIHPKNMAEKKAINMRILTTSKNSYTFEFGIVGSDEKQRGTVEKISDFK
jgi:hypothetical protein